MRGFSNRGVSHQPAIDFTWRD